MSPLALMVSLAATMAAPDFDPNLPLMAWGPSASRGRLVNVTIGAGPMTSIHPVLPTVVVAHGANPFHRALRYAIAERYAEAFGARYGPAVQVLAWDWNADTLRHLPLAKPNIDHVAHQGQLLASAIIAAGVDSSRLHLIGQSSGCVVVTAAARSLTNGGRPPARLTVLDPARIYHDLVFVTLGAGSAASRVDHVWVDGMSAFGMDAPYPGVRNTRLDGTRGVLGLVRPMHSDHFASVRWHIGQVGR